MKRLFVLLLAATMVFTFYACGTGDNTQEKEQEPVVSLPDSSKKVPTEELIMEDISNELLERNQYATLTGVETVKSLTNEGSYEITLSITAETKYADWTYVVDLNYTEYDQGWMLDDVDWTNESYDQVRTPDVDTMVEYATKYLCEHNVYSEVSFSKYMTPMSLAELYLVDENEADCMLMLQWETIEGLKHALNYYEFKSWWQYDSNIDNWILVEDDSHGSLGYMVKQRFIRCSPDYRLDFSGYWHRDETNALGSFSHTIDITNFSWEGFDACIPEVSSEVTHYEYTEDAPYEIAYSADLIFTNGKNEYIIFMFSEDGTAIKYFGETGYVLVRVTDDLPTLY